MFAAFFKPTQRSTIPHRLYGAVMAQSRQPWLFCDAKIPDTVMGRFDMLALHTYMLARRMVAEGDDICRALNQEIFDLFVADIDRALRELGIGDTSVPKRKKKMVRSFYGQIEDFDAPLDARDRMMLEQRIAERYFSGAGDGDARHLARYMLETDQALRDQPVADLLSGELTWPEFVR